MALATRKETFDPQKQRRKNQDIEKQIRKIAGCSKNVREFSKIETEISKLIKDHGPINDLLIADVCKMYFGEPAYRKFQKAAKGLGERESVLMKDFKKLVTDSKNFDRMLSNLTRDLKRKKW